MRASKTKERILLAAADIFAAEGLHGPTAVDVASALGISPGHLYYHFKGKAEIVTALFERHREEMALILSGMAGAEPKLEELWTHVQIVLEEIHDTRFIYRDMAAASALSETVAKGLRAIILALRRILNAMLTHMIAIGTLPPKPGLIEHLTEQMLLGLLYRLNQQEVERPNETPREAVSRAALFVMSLIAAHVDAADAKPN
jgi:AcrR family transcriptional regulator